MLYKTVSWKLKEKSLRTALITQNTSQNVAWTIDNSEKCSLNILKSKLNFSPPAKFLYFLYENVIQVSKITGL